MSTSYPDTNLPANYRLPAKSRRANSMKHEESPPPPNDSNLPLANIFASILDDDFPLEASTRPAPYYPQAYPQTQPQASPPQQRTYQSPAVPGESYTLAKKEKAGNGDVVMEIKRVHDDERDGVQVFFSAKYRKPLFAILIIFLMAATGNLSEIFQFIVKYF